MNNFRRAKLLKIKLLKRNIKQKQIAEKLGVSRSQACLLVNGKRYSEAFEKLVESDFAGL